MKHLAVKFLYTVLLGVVLAEFPPGMTSNFPYGVQVMDVETPASSRSSASLIFKFVEDDSKTVTFDGVTYKVPFGVNIKEVNSCIGDASQDIAATSSVDDFYSAQESSMRMGYDQTTTVAVEYPPASASQDIRSAAMVGRSKSSKFAQASSEASIQVFAEARAVHTQYTAEWAHYDPEISDLDKDFKQDAKSLSEESFQQFLNQYGMYYLRKAHIGSTISYTMSFDAGTNKNTVDRCVAESRGLEFAHLGGEAGGSSSSQECQSQEVGETTAFQQSSIELLGASGFNALDELCSYTNRNPVLVGMEYESITKLLKLLEVDQGIIDKWWTFASEALVDALQDAGQPICSMSGCSEGCECSSNYGCVKKVEAAAHSVTGFRAGMTFSEECCDSNTFNPITKMDCYDGWCDNMILTEISDAITISGETVRLATLNDEEWSAWISNENFQTEDTCRDGKVVTMMQCMPGRDYCGVLQLKCESPDETWSINADVWEWTEKFSQEVVGFGQCPTGYVVIGMHCEGKHCSLKKLKCAQIMLQTTVECEGNAAGYTIVANTAAENTATGRVDKKGVATGNMATRSAITEDTRKAVHDEL